VLGRDDGRAPFGVWMRQARWSARSKPGSEARSCHGEGVARYNTSGGCSDLRVMCFSMSCQWRGREVSELDVTLADPAIRVKTVQAG
jgi:hypothetical protein